MDDAERKIFWKTLCSLEGIDIENDMTLLNETIIYSKYIYRFRAVDERTLNALRENKLYFSTSNYYDKDTAISGRGLSKYRTEIVQEFCFAFSEEIRRQVFYATFLQNI